MFLTPKALSKATIEFETLKKDRRSCLRVGPCGIGKEAVYLNSFYIDRRYYIPISNISRIYKRVAMSKGGYTGKGVFGSMPYLVVVFDNGQEKACNFKVEPLVDQFLVEFKKRFPHIPTVSEQGEKRLAEAAEAERKRYDRTLSDTALEAKTTLEEAEKLLENVRAACDELAFSAKQKRMTEKTNPFYRHLALLVAMAGVFAIGIGIYAIIRHEDTAVYFVLFGFAAIFVLVAARVRPTGAKNKADAIEEWKNAITAMEKSLPSDFPVPAKYAHPYTIARMIRIIREGRAETVEASYDILKSDLKALNSSVQVDQRDYDEIIVIKPMFLAADYE